jgi:hypothetical protein
MIENKSDNGLFDRMNSFKLIVRKPDGKEIVIEQTNQKGKTKEEGK